MISSDPVQFIIKWPYQYKVVDETPDVVSHVHRYSVLCFKKSFLNGAYVLQGGDREVFAESAEKAVNVYREKGKKKDGLG